MLARRKFFSSRACRLILRSWVTAGMREGSSFSWFLTDHLGSVVGVTDADATLISQTRYTPFGEIRSDVGTVTETDYGYTFQ